MYIKICPLHTGKDVENTVAVKMENLNLLRDKVQYLRYSSESATRSEVENLDYNFLKQHDSVALMFYEFTCTY